jgi:hypothetical protein
VLSERVDGFAGFGHWLGCESDDGSGVNCVDKLASWQDAVEAVGDRLGGLRRHWHADEVIVAADGDVVGQYVDRRGNFWAVFVDGEAAAHFDGDELP